MGLLSSVTLAAGLSGLGRGEPTVKALDILVRAKLRECRSGCAQLERSGIGLPALEQ